MPLILRSVKGSKLTIPEMDGNLTYLSSTLSGSVIQVTGSSIDAPNTSITASSFIGSGSGIIGVISSSYANSSSWSPTPNLESVLTVGSNLVNSYTILSTETLNIQTNFDSQIGKIATDTNYVELSAISGSNSSSIKITGNNIVITGSIQHGNSTSAPGLYSHAEGNGAVSFGIQSHAEGDGTIASGSYSHAEGLSTIAIGEASHAEGNSAQTIGDYSHAEGADTRAIGDHSHAEGTGTYAIGQGSHAEGDTTTALGMYSHTGGNNTIASGSFQTVFGKFNTEGDTTSLFIVGGGDTSSRKDAFKVTHSSSIIVATQSAAPGWVGKEGEMVPANNGGVYYIYTYIGGAWRSASLS